MLGIAEQRHINFNAAIPTAHFIMCPAHPTESEVMLAWHYCKMATASWQTVTIGWRG